jgi:adenylosuccinate synthase
MKAGKLVISDRAHVILPYHQVIDALDEGKKGSLAAGTTGRGIGPCYADKASRFGLRMCDLIDPAELERKLKVAYPVKRAYIESLGGKLDISMEDMLARCRRHGEALSKHVGDASLLINGALDDGAAVLFEGAQGVHLDIDHGIYPHGTSSATVTGGCCTGAGVPPKRIDKVVGVVKAYTSRVGEGPFPTELFDETGKQIGAVGKEFGTTTGRPRRVGWLDLVMLRYSVRVCGLDSIALTKSDVLCGLPEVKVCTHYEFGGSEVRDFPASMKVLSGCRPVYKTFKGWPRWESSQWAKGAAQGRKGLPRELAYYVEFIESELGVPVGLVSYGPGRDENICLD